MTNAEARFNNPLRPRKPEGSLGRTAQDVHLDSHTAPELCGDPFVSATFRLPAKPAPQRGRWEEPAVQKWASCFKHPRSFPTTSTATTTACGQRQRWPGDAISLTATAEEHPNTVTSAPFRHPSVAVWYGAHRHPLRSWAAPPPQSSYGALPPPRR